MNNDTLNVVPKIPNVLVDSYYRYTIILEQVRIIGDDEIETLVLDSMERVWDCMNEKEQQEASKISKITKGHISEHKLIEV